MAAVEHATHRLLRMALLFGLVASIIALATTLLQPAGLTTVALAAAWTAAWGIASARPHAVVVAFAHWRWTMIVVAGLGSATIVASGGFNSLLKTEAEWLAWAAPVLLDTGASLAVAAVMSGGLLTALLAAGMAPSSIITGPHRYIAVTDILNPFVVVLLALVVTGVFRLVLQNAVPTLWRARQGDQPGSSPGMRALLAGAPVLALPAGEVISSPLPPSAPLSAAERDILERLANGQTPQQIALARRVRDDTVYAQIGSAKQKAGAATIEHLVALAWRPPT
jgi:DNA-binding CsgD family transcriptional regulator